jgi:hypothetical protein
MDPDDVYFPDASEVTLHGTAFVRMMLAHVAFEREVGALQDTIVNQPGFSEQRSNQWGTKQRPKRMIELIKKHLGDIPQIEPIAKLLCEAVDPCEQRNLLAHGTWWRFNRRTASITVRGGTRWLDPETPPAQRDYTAADIEALANQFENIWSELFKLRREIEPQPTESEIRAALGNDSTVDD